MKVDADEMDELMADNMEMECATCDGLFFVETILLLCSRTPGVYNLPSSARKPYHTNVVVQVTHYWRSGADCEAVRDQLDYEGRGRIPTTHL